MSLSPNGKNVSVAPKSIRISPGVFTHQLPHMLDYIELTPARDSSGSAYLVYFDETSIHTGPGHYVRFTMPQHTADVWQGVRIYFKPFSEARKFRLVVHVDIPANNENMYPFTIFIDDATPNNNYHQDIIQGGSSTIEIDLDAESPETELSAGVFQMSQQDGPYSWNFVSARIYLQ